MRVRDRALSIVAFALVVFLLLGEVDVAQAREERAASRGRDVEYIVPVVALRRQSGMQALVDRLWEARIPYYVEPIATAQGLVYRVRVGPFAGRAEAERMRERLRGMGLEPDRVRERN